MISNKNNFRNFFKFFIILFKNIINELCSIECKRKQHAHQIEKIENEQVMAVSKPLVFQRPPIIILK